MDFSTNSENQIFRVENGLPEKDAHIRLIWGHGWGQDYRVFKQLAESLKTQAHNLLLDFPGFGQSPPPPKVWDTMDYTSATAEMLQNLPFQGKNIWVGHSFGCRIGLQLAARYPEMLDGLILIASAGLPRKRSIWKKVCFKSRIYAFKLLKQIWIFLGKNVDTLRQRFGSLDYRNAGVLRETFMKVIAEDLSEVASKVKCPVLLIYGTNDTETPPEIGERLHKLISNSRLIILNKQDHHSLLASGRHQTLKHLHRFIKDLT